MDLKPIGHRIKEARENARITQEELAAAVNCTPQHISAIERGVKTPRLDTFIVIANTVGVSADMLLRDVLTNLPESIDGDFSGKITPEIRRRILRAIQAFCED